MSWVPDDDYSDCDGLVCCLCGQDDTFIRHNKLNKFNYGYDGWCDFCNDHSVLVTLEKFEE